MSISLKKWGNTSQDRNFRNDTNLNWQTIENSFNGLSRDSQEAVQNAIVAIINANKALDESKNIQNQLNELVVAGDSSVESAQARVDISGKTYDTLKERIDFNEREMDKVSEANAKFKLTLLSAYGDIDGYHPSVIRFPNKWNGYYYWMAFTPYPQSDQAKENPHVLASNDMVTWVEPPGFRNPLEPQPPGTPDKQYNSDTHMVYNYNLNRIEVFWRFVDDTAGTVTIYRKISTDGVIWSGKEAVLHNVRSQLDYLSPAVIYENNKYKMWTITGRYKVIYSESDLGINWEPFREIEIPFESKMNPWHLDVIHTDKGYEMLVVAFADGQDRNSMELFHTSSTDNITYSTAKVILRPSKQEFTWDNRGIYRSCFLKINGIYYVYYSGVNKKWERGTGLCFGENLEHLKGLEQHDLFIQRNIRALNMVYGAFLRNYALQITAPRDDGSFWKACLRLSGAGEAKLVDDFDLDNLIKLALKEVRTTDGMSFIGKSAYYNSNEFKIYEPGKASVVGIGAPDFLRPKMVGNTSLAGGVETSGVLFEDNWGQGITTQLNREGVIRYDSKRKKHIAHNGTGWVDLY